MSKRMDNTAIVNDLKGASAFFSKTAITEPAAAPQLSPSPPQQTEDNHGGYHDQPAHKTRPHTANGPTERSGRTASVPPASHAPTTAHFMHELNHTREDDNNRPRDTKRFSFEIFADQTKLIEDVKYWYQKRSGTPLSKSRILRDLIDRHLPEILDELTGNAPNSDSLSRELAADSAPTRHE